MPRTRYDSRGIPIYDGAIPERLSQPAATNAPPIEQTKYWEEMAKWAFCATCSSALAKDYAAKFGGRVKRVAPPAKVIEDAKPVPKPAEVLAMMRARIIVLDEKDVLTDEEWSELKKLRDKVDEMDQAGVPNHG
jgi:hypothetical protein